MHSKKPRVVVVGAGFGGVSLCKALHKMPVEVTLVDKHNYHTFIPLLYQVATGGLEPDSIAYPVRRILRRYENVHFQMAEVERVDPGAKRLETTIGPIEYDYLVIATGSTNNFYNFEPIKERVMSLKSVPDALNIRSQLMQNLELAVATFDHSERSQLMNIAIIGGGPAGVEMAGALAEMKHYVFPKDFPQIDFSRMSITLFEAAGKLMGGMSDEASARSLSYLQGLGVDVRLNTKVSDYDSSYVLLEDGTRFQTDTVIWTAGVKGAPLEGLPAEALAGAGRIAVDAFNRVHGLENIFAIGDVAACADEEAPGGQPMLAPVAIQQATRLAANLDLLLQKKPLQPFRYRNKGVMATIGKHKAVVDLPRWKFQGAFAWFVWMFVHIASLVGFRNKVVTLIGWLTNYFNYDRPLGLIIRPYKKVEAPPVEART